MQKSKLFYLKLNAGSFATALLDMYKYRNMTSMEAFSALLAVASLAFAQRNARELFKEKR